jgi:hypothetical protein
MLGTVPQQRPDHIDMRRHPVPYMGRSREHPAIKGRLPQNNSWWRRRDQLRIMATCQPGSCFSRAWRRNADTVSPALELASRTSSASVGSTPMSRRT